MKIFCETQDDGKKGSGFYLGKERPSYLDFEYFVCFEWTDFSESGKEVDYMILLFFSLPSFVFGCILGGMD